MLIPRSGALLSDCEAALSFVPQPFSDTWNVQCLYDGFFGRFRDESHLPGQCGNAVRLRAQSAIVLCSPWAGNSFMARLNGTITH